MNDLKATLKVVIIALFVFYFSGISKLEAQEISEWKIGVSIDRSSLDLKRGLSGRDNFITPLTGFTVSVQPVFQINDDISFATGLEYNYFNYSFPSIIISDNLIEEVGNPYVSYISLPLMLNFQPFHNLRSFKLTGGFRISRRFKSSDGRIRISEGDSVRARAHYASQYSNYIILGYTLGIGYRFPGRLQAIGVDLLYHQDLTPFYNIARIAFVGIETPREINTWRRSIGLRMSYTF